jgi:hypothetical protein
MYPGVFNEMLEKFKPLVAEIQQRHAGKAVVHYDIRSVQQMVKVNPLQRSFPITGLAFELASANEFPHSAGSQELQSGIPKAD